jgi:hypothetical protein
VPDQRQLHSSLPSHLAEVLPFVNGAQNFGDNSGMIIFVVYLNFPNGPLPFWVMLSMGLSLFHMLFK